MIGNVLDAIIYGDALGSNKHRAHCRAYGFTSYGGVQSELDPINSLAEATPGFIWRLQSDSGNATDIVYSEDPFELVNMSVWESLKRCAITSTNRIILNSSNAAPSGSRRQHSLRMLFGGFLRDTSQQLRRQKTG